MACLDMDDKDEFVLLGDVLPAPIVEFDGVIAGVQTQQQTDFELLRSVMEARLAALNQSLSQQEHMIHALTAAEAHARQQNNSCMDRIASLEQDLASRDQQVLGLCVALAAAEAPTSMPVLRIPCTSKSQELLHAQDQVLQLKQALQEAHSVQLQEAVGNHKAAALLEAQVKTLRLEQETLRRQLSNCHAQQERDQRQHALELAQLRKASNTAQQRLAAIQEEHRASRARAKAKEEEASHASKQVRQLQQELDRARSPAPYRSCTPTPNTRAFTPPPTKRFSTPPPVKRTMTPPPATRGSLHSTPSPRHARMPSPAGQQQDQVPSTAWQRTAVSAARARTPPHTGRAATSAADGARQGTAHQGEGVTSPRSHPIVKSPRPSPSPSPGPGTRHGSPPWRFPKRDTDAHLQTPLPAAAGGDGTASTTLSNQGQQQGSVGKGRTSGRQAAGMSGRHASPLSVPHSASPRHERDSCRSPTVWRGVECSTAASLFKDLPSHTCSTVTGVTAVCKADAVGIQHTQNQNIVHDTHKAGQGSCSPAHGMKSRNGTASKADSLHKGHRQILAATPPGSPACRGNNAHVNQATFLANPSTPTGCSAVQLWDVHAAILATRQGPQGGCGNDVNSAAIATGPHLGADHLATGVSQLVQNYLRAVNARNVASTRLGHLLQQKQALLHNASAGKHPAGTVRNSAELDSGSYGSAETAPTLLVLQHNLGTLQHAVQRADGVLAELQRRLVAMPVAGLQSALQVALHALVAATSAPTHADGPADVTADANTSRYAAHAQPAEVPRSVPVLCADEDAQNGTADQQGIPSTLKTQEAQAQLSSQGQQQRRQAQDMSPLPLACTLHVETVGTISTLHNHQAAATNGDGSGHAKNDDSSAAQPAAQTKLSTHDIPPVHTKPAGSTTLVSDANLEGDAVLGHICTGVEQMSPSKAQVALLAELPTAAGTSPCAASGPASDNTLLAELPTAAGTSASASAASGPASDNTLAAAAGCQGAHAPAGSTSMVSPAGCTWGCSTFSAALYGNAGMSSTSVAPDQQVHQSRAQVEPQVSQQSVTAGTAATATCAVTRACHTIKQASLGAAVPPCGMCNELAAGDVCDAFAINGRLNAIMHLPAAAAMHAIDAGGGAAAAAAAASTGGGDGGAATAAAAAADSRGGGGGSGAALQAGSGADTSFRHPQPALRHSTTHSIQDSASAYKSSVEVGQATGISGTVQYTAEGCADATADPGRSSSPGRVTMQLPQVLQLDESSSGGSVSADCKSATDQGMPRLRFVSVAGVAPPSASSVVRCSLHRYSQSTSLATHGKAHLPLQVADDDLSDGSPRAQPTHQSTARTKLKSVTSPGDRQPHSRTAATHRMTESSALPARTAVPRRRSRSLVLSPRGVPLAAAARHSRAQSLSQAVLNFGVGSMSAGAWTKLHSPIKPPPSVKTQLFGSSAITGPTDTVKQ